MGMELNGEQKDMLDPLLETRVWASQLSTLKMDPRVLPMVSHK